MFGLGLGEVLIIILAVLLFINPKKMPELIRKLGKNFGRLQKLAYDFKREVNEDEEIKYRNQ